MRVASLRLRLSAALVDAAVSIGVSAVAGGAALAGVAAYERVRGDEDGADGEPEDGPSKVHIIGAFRPSPQLRAALSGASAGLAVAGRNWRGPGFRALGLRRVDAKTGGIVTVRSALIGVWFDQAWRTSVNSLSASRAQRQRERISALDPQLRMVEREYADDPQARLGALMELYKANDVDPFYGCGWQLAAPIVSQAALTLGTRGGRTLRDRITGTEVVVDR